MNVDSWFESAILPPAADSFPENANPRKSIHILELDSIGFRQLNDGDYILNLCFYDFSFGCFVGNQLELNCLSKTSCIHLKQNIIVCSRADRNSLIVIELANREKFSLGWTVISLSDVSEQIGPDDFASSSILQRFPFFSGSCRMLLLVSCINQLQSLCRKDAVLSAHKRISTTLIDLPLPLFYFIPQSSLNFMSELPKISVILDNILLSHSNGNQFDCDSVMLDLLSHELYYAMNERWIHGTSNANLQILERRLRIGAHNGLTFLEEPIFLLLEPLPFLPSHGDTLLLLKHSFGRSSTAVNIDFGVRQCVRFHKIPIQSEFSIVFQLFYLVACPNNKGLITNARLINVAWTAWSPFVEGRLHSGSADTISLHMVGGPRFSPTTLSCCFRDLSTLPSTSEFAQCTSLALNRVRIDINFNFASLTNLNEDNVSEPSRRSSEGLVQQLTPSLGSYNIPKAQDEEKSHRHQVSYSSKSPESASDVSPNVDFELLEENSTLLRPTKVTSETPFFVQVQKSESYGAIFFELPIGRISALPRILISQLTKFPPIILDGPSPKAVNVETQNESPPDMELEFGERLWTASEFCLQFLAYSPSSVGFPCLQTPEKLFFTFQFYRFHSYVTESLSTNCGEENLLLWRKDAQQDSHQPGLTLRFVIDGSQQQDFCTYLLKHNLILHVWEADSIFHLGVVSIPLKHLLRQGSPAVQCSVQCQVFQSGFPPDLTPSQGTSFNGMLYLRLANIGLSAPTAKNVKNSSTIIKRVRQLPKIQETPLEQFMTLHKIDFVQRAAQIFDPKEQQRILNWNRMKESEKTGDIRYLSWKNEGKPQKFLFAEELLAYRALRTENKAHALLKAVFSSITTRMHVDLTFGQLYLFSFKFINPLAEEFVCELESNDKNLGPICSSDELRYLQSQLNDIYRIAKFDVANLPESHRLCWRLGCRPMEHLEIPMRFDSGLADMFGNSDNQQFIQGDCRLFVRKLPSGNPLAIFELNYTIWRPFLTHHLRWFTEECRKLTRVIRLPMSFGFIRCSDPTIYCQLFEEGQLLRIECQVSETPNIRDFLVFFYNENFSPIELRAVWRVSIHSFRRLHSETVQGQPVRIPLNFADNDLLSTPGGELIRLFCSPPLQSHFHPGSVFSASNMAIQLAILLNVQQLGRSYLLVNAVRSSSQQIISQWLLTLTVGKPNITKTFQVIVPSQLQTVVHKKIPLDNPLSIEREFRLTSSDPSLLYIPIPSPPPIPPNSVLPVQLDIQAVSSSNRPTQRQVLLFIQDSQTGNQEETFQLNIRFH